MDYTSYKMYVKEITKYSLLSADEEIELSKKIQSGDAMAKQDLINANLRYVVSIALKYSKDDDSLMDSIQEGNLGLIVAASKFDYTFNTRFSTYAHPWIVQYVLRHKKILEPSVKIPFLKTEQLRIIKQAEEVLNQRLLKKPTIQEISVYTGLDEALISELQMYDYKICSIDEELGEGSTLCVSQLLCDERSDIEGDVLGKIERQEFIQYISDLPERERIVMMYRYGSFIYGKKVNYRILSTKLGVSIEGTRQIEIRAKLRLKQIFMPHISGCYHHKMLS